MTTRDGRTALDQAVAAVREDEAPAGAAEAAADRVRARLADVVGAGSPACQNVKDDVEALRGGRLREARRLLVEDHLRECASCRAAHGLVGPARVVTLPWTTGVRRPEAPRRPGRLAAAAAIFFAVGAGFFARDLLFRGPAGPQMAVQAVSGELYQIASEPRPLVPGAQVGADEKVRTSRAGNAVMRLADGSTVEMDARSELSVDSEGRDTTLRLARGNIIVEAAKRTSGRLRVDADGLEIAVTGTVFSVSHGVAGSRVSVLEGEVRVTHSGREVVLGPGDQFTTSRAGRRVPVRDDVAWSRHRARHEALLTALAGLQKDLRSVTLPGLRYESRLLPALPADTGLYVALPNYGDALGQAYGLFKQRLQSTPAMQQAWAKSGLNREPARLDAIVAALIDLGDRLGDEVVIAAAGTGPKATPLLVAEVRGAGVAEALARVFQSGPGRPVPFLDPGAVAGASHPLVATIAQGRLAVGAPASVSAFLAASAVDGGFAATPFGQRLLQTYEDGAGLVFGADLQRVVAGPGASEAFVRSGLADAHYLIVERRDVEGRSEQRAELSFNGPRRGVASWLAAPAPMGALRFVSASASGAGAFVFKSPELVLDDILAVVAGGGRPLEDAQSRLGIDLREDVVRSLGGEVALALDGPLLPSPSWKLVVEVYDPARLQSALARVVARIQEDSVEGGVLQLDQEQVDGTTYQVLRGSQGGRSVEIHYAFIDGYVVVTPNRALLARAIDTYRRGSDLGRSPAFTTLLPDGGTTNVSGLIYQNLGPVAGAVESMLEAGGTGLSGEVLKEWAATAPPSLQVFYGEDTRIRQAGTGAALGLDLGSWMLPALLGQVTKVHPRVHR